MSPSNGLDDQYSRDSNHPIDSKGTNPDIESGSIAEGKLGKRYNEDKFQCVRSDIDRLRYSYATENVLSSGLSLSTYDESERDLGNRTYLSTDQKRMHDSKSMGDVTKESIGNPNTSIVDNSSLLNISIDESIETVDTLTESPESSPNKKNRVRSIRFAATNEIRTYTPNPEEFIDNPLDHFNDTLSCGARTRQFFAASALPLTYGATSSLTTLYLLYELMFRYEVKHDVLGLYLVGVYLCRVLFSSICRYSPKTFALLGSCMSLLGFTAIYFSQGPQMAGSTKETEERSGTGLTLFIIGSILSNCNETIGANQIFVRDQNLQNIKYMASNLKMQYLLVKFARIGSFVGAGFLYHFYGVRAVAIMGAGLVSLQIIFLCAYLALDVYRMTHDPNNLFGDDFVNHSPKCRLNCSLRAARGRRRLFKSAMSKLNRNLFKYYPSNIAPNRLKSIISCCVFGRALSSVCVWISSTVILVDEFGANVLLVGGIFACATAIDFVSSWIVLRDRCRRKTIPSPREIFFCMGGILLSSATITAPHLYAYIAGFFTFAIFNSNLRLLLIELQGRSNDATESITLQLVRRFCIAGTLYAIPLLHSVYPTLPFALAFVFILASLLMLIMSLCCCRNCRIFGDAQHELDDEMKNRSAREMSKKNRPSTKPERNLSFAERTMLTRLIKGQEI